ncbi:MAG TPA: hypothetical protein VJN62_03130 [Gemmatimonadales bacterium]|nr:hypothetical protein [Gemmatimonadales bacterium]
MKAILTTLVLVAGATCASAQGMLPSWADSAFRASPAAGLRYSLTSRLTVGDFDGDGLDDVAIEVQSENLDRGIVIIHRIDRSVHVLGAGRDVGNGDVEIRNWGVTELRHHKDAIVVVRPDNKNGLLVWDGQTYRWVPDE